MDAKSKANFINSVASGQAVPCPKCSTINKPDSTFCIACGAKLSPTAASNDAPAFSPISEDSQKATEHVEPTSAFADGLPSWDIVPPQVMVRRR